MYNQPVDKLPANLYDFAPGEMVTTYTVTVAPDCTWTARLGPYEPSPDDISITLNTALLPHSPHKPGNC